MYIDGETLLFSIVVIAAVAGFVGYERGKKAQVEQDQFWTRARSDLASMADALPQTDKEALASEIAAVRAERNSHQAPD